MTENIVKLIGAEVISVNEGRRLLSMNRRPGDGGDEFRNPNINTTPPQASTLRINAQGTRKRRKSGPLRGADKAAIARLVAERIEKLRQIARGQAERAAKSPNFLKWLDAWLASFELRVADAMAPIVDVLRILRVECDAQAIARRHIAHEHAGLLEISGRVTIDNLEAAIIHYFETDREWPKQLAEEIISHARNEIATQQKNKQPSE